jgi:hypothetical protein
LQRTPETEHLIDLAGVTAHSHGLAIRDYFDYLDAQYHTHKEIRGTHPVYCMALLRIADLLQLQSERAPRQVRQVRALRSPVSQGEWEMHQAITDLNYSEFPETLYLVARPSNRTRRALGGRGLAIRGSG